MSIKTRFLLSYIGVIVIFITLLLVVGFLFLFAITGDLRSIEHFYNKSYVQKPLTNVEESAFTDLMYMAKKEQQSLSDEEKLKEIEADSIDILIKREQELVYTSPNLNEKNLLESLPEFESTNINTRGSMKTEDNFYTYVKYDFYFANKDKGSVFVLRKVNPYAELTREWFPLLFGLLLFLFTMAIGILNYLVSRSIIKPILVMKEGAERIKEGNLDFEMTPTSNDEIGQLNRAFEEMRIKLKESIQMQLQYEENRKELLSNISHDLKTPITSILGYVEGIRDGVANTEEKREKYLTTISTKAKDMDVLIDELFLFSKLDLKKVPFNFETIPLHNYMSDYVGETSLDLVEIDVHITLLSQENSLYVKADRDKLRRVLSNLISNCVKYMDKKYKQITIELIEKQDEVMIQVSDNGSGIEEAALPYIFDRFYRAELSRNSQTGGSGLGLAIAKQIVLEHGGDIWATSEFGKGTTIHFSLKKVEGRGGK
ncbi:sensor histidine kinase [Priestia taiwanensis]|uniref:histidine kinase n=1 Tax=Priestia taiwanensis TaxID=1347902 RepID=A0A917AX55_9BACI|nr:HAMP domain-containing sensor histidine kinase [Priestia taiwanensis]MBM7365048.1 histidine kinase [Priestia taiwanensis]GGE83678.1 two-component sensor histidine kinase [Priestia taiwanensis]